MSKFSLDLIRDFVSRNLSLVDDELNGEDFPESLWYLRAKGEKPVLKIERETYDSNAIVVWYKRAGAPPGESKASPFEQCRSEDQQGVIRVLREIFCV